MHYISMYLISHRSIAIDYFECHLCEMESQYNRHVKSIHNGLNVSIYNVSSREKKIIYNKFLHLIIRRGLARQNE